MTTPPSDTPLPPDEPTPPAAPAPDASPANRIDVALPCIECGYDLRHHDTDQRCPECGAPVRTIREFVASLRYVNELNRSAWLLSYLPVIMIAPMVFIASRSGALPSPVSLLASCCSLIAALAYPIIAIVFLSAAREVGREAPPRNWLLLIVTLSYFLALGPLFFLGESVLLALSFAILYATIAMAVSHQVRRIARLDRLRWSARAAVLVSLPVHWMSVAAFWSLAAVFALLLVLRPFQRPIHYGDSTALTSAPVERALYAGALILIGLHVIQMILFHFWLCRIRPVVTAAIQLAQRTTSDAPTPPDGPSPPTSACQ